MKGGDAHALIDVVAVNFGAGRAAGPKREKRRKEDG